MPGPGIVLTVSKAGQLGLPEPYGHRCIDRVTEPAAPGASRHPLYVRTGEYPSCRIGAASVEFPAAPPICGCLDSGGPRETEPVEPGLPGLPAVQTIGPSRADCIRPRP